MTEETKKATDKPAAKKPAASKAAAKPAAKAAGAKPAAKKAAAPKAKPATSGAQIRVKQTGSPLGRKADQRLCLIGLGLNKVNRERVLEDTPAVRGLINKVKHLVQVQAA